VGIVGSQTQATELLGIIIIIGSSISISNDMLHTIQVLTAGHLACTVT
jgi:hypothetical protein